MKKLFLNFAYIVPIVTLFALCYMYNRWFTIPVGMEEGYKFSESQILQSALIYLTLLIINIGVIWGYLRSKGRYVVNDIIVLLLLSVTLLVAEVGGFTKNISIAKSYLWDLVCNLL